MSRKRWMILCMGAALFMAASACTPTTPVPITVVPGGATARATGAPAAGIEDLVADLRDAGNTVEVGARIEQPYLPIAGTAVNVDGTEVQVFEFADTAARVAVTDALLQNEETETGVLPEGVNLWVEDRMVVLYLGQDQATREMLNDTLGEPLDLGGGWTGLPPEAVLDAQRWLADQLNTAAEQVTIVTIEQAEWSDSCLGLGGAAESCAAVITPGWRAIFEADGQRYEVRTDETGGTIRLATGDTSQSKLAGTEWRLTEFGPEGAEAAPVAGSTITLAFDTGGKLSGSGGCNSYGGDYQADSSMLAIGAVAATLRACADAGVTEQEQRYLAALETVQDYEITETELTLSYDGGTLRFAPAEQ